MAQSLTRGDFKQNVLVGERFYPFHSGEEKDLQSSIKKVKDYLNGITDHPEFQKGKGTDFASRIILNSNNLDVRDCLEKYKKFHSTNLKLAQGSPNPKDRILRMLSVFTEAGAISIKNYKIIFEPILINRISVNPISIP